MNQSNIYQAQQVCKVKYLPNCIEYGDKALFVGDAKGKIYKYKMELDFVEVQTNHIASKDISSKKIDSIKCVFGLILVLADGVLCSYESQTLEKEQEILRNVTMFQMNESAGSIGSIILITNKKEGLIFKFSRQENRFIQSTFRINLPAIPYALCWQDKTIVLSYPKKEFSIIHSETMKVNTLDVPIGPYPLIKSTNADEYLVLSMEQIGIFIQSDGSMSQKSNLDMSKEKPLQIVIQSFYIIILFDNYIQVFSSIDSKKLQQIDINNQGKCFSLSEQVFFSTLNEIFYLQPTPYQMQIEKCLQRGNINDAFRILDLHVSQSSPEWKKKYNTLQIDSIWILIADMQFDQAKEFIFETNFDIREILKAFDSWISHSHNLQASSKKEEVKPVKILISNYIKNNKMSQDKQNTLYNEAKAFLTVVLEHYESKYSLYPENSEIDFTSNKYQFPKIYTSELMSIMEFVLIKLYCDGQKYEALKQLLLRPIKKTVQEEIEKEILTLDDNYKDDILGRFYEGSANYKKAFTICKQLIQKSTRKDEILRDMVRILGKSKDGNLISEHLEFILTQNLEIGQEIFDLTPLSVMLPDQMISKISDLKKPQLKEQALERYLEIIIGKDLEIDERFYTILCLHYAEQLFKLRPKNADANLKKNEPNYEQIQVLKKKFDAFLRKHKKYSSEKILNTIQGSWLVSLEIYLYEKEKRHTDAIQKYIDIKQFDYAEEYCSKQNDDLLTEMFRIYVTNYQNFVNKNEIMSEEKQKNHQMLMARMKNFLKKFGTHPQLDMVKVLEIIPNDWLVNESNDESGIYSFLKNAISHCLNQKRVINCARHVAEMDLLNIECDLVQAKRANVRITKDKRCSVCDNKIGEKMFVVYPNGVIVHHTCISNRSLSECPVTKQNFEKTYKD